MRSTRALLGLGLTLLVAVGSGEDAYAQSMPAARRDSILAVVRAYVDASNRVDVQAMIDAYSR